MKRTKIAAITKKARRKTGMSKVEFAGLFGKSPGTVTAWEQGVIKDRDTYELLKKLAAHTNRALPSKQDLKQYKVFAATGRYYMLYKLLEALFASESKAEKMPDLEIETPEQLRPLNPETSEQPETPEQLKSPEPEQPETLEKE